MRDSKLWRASATARSSEAGWPLRFSRALFLLYLLLLAWAPLPLGSNRVWSWSLLEVWVYCLGAATVIAWGHQACSVWKQDPARSAAGAGGVATVAGLFEFSNACAAIRHVGVYRVFQCRMVD